MSGSGVSRIALVLCAALLVLGQTSCSDERETGPAKASEATSAEDIGGMDALVRAAKAEGRLNAIALPPKWANGVGLAEAFEKKYGIDVTLQSPFASSEEELEAVRSRKGQENAPDVLDLGPRFARNAAQEDLVASYRVANYADIPDNQKDEKARWYNSYGGYVAIGCDAGRITVCPVSFADLLEPQYKDKVSLTGLDPRTAEVAFASVFAASLANDGSLDDVQPGIDFFAKLDAVGNLRHINPNPPDEKIKNGETPIIIEWDFLSLTHVDQFRGTPVEWRVSIPFDGSFSEYYAQAINKGAPHPAAARLWMEFVFSAEGQNLRLVDFARPVLFDSMRKSGTLDEARAAALPTVEGTPVFPTEAQDRKARQTVDEGWARAVSG